MVALGIKAANAEPREQISLHIMRIELMTRSFSILRDAGVSFAGLFNGDYKDIDLVRDVNIAIRTTLDEQEIEQDVITATIDSVWQVFLDWDFRLP
ncbi:MAG: hypothetical protein IPK93_02375 [Solirubrobacterales bacterium]|nr:hypothetical protein [Solirubrobacterales bacterium]